MGGGGGLIFQLALKVEMEMLCCGVSFFPKILFKISKEATALHHVC